MQQTETTPEHGAREVVASAAPPSARLFPQAAAVVQNCALLGILKRPLAQVEEPFRQYSRRSMLQVIYASAATRLLDKDELRSLLTVAAATIRRLGFQACCFMTRIVSSVLEGRPKRSC